jgi:hypothetical protein
MTRKEDIDDVCGRRPDISALHAAAPEATVIGAPSIRVDGGSRCSR